MAVFSSRSAGYKGGVVLLFFATVVFIVGFAVPFWAFTTFDLVLVKISYQFGLWMICLSHPDDYSNTNCATIGLNRSEGWFHAVRAMECLCLLGLLASCVLALVTNCCRTVPGPHNRALEILASLSGLTGFVGCMVFVGSVTDSTHFGFYLATIGSGLCVVAAFIIAMSNTPTEAGTQTVNTVPMTSVPQGQGQDQGQPAAEGAFHGQIPAQPAGNAQSYGNYPQSYGYPQLQGYNQSYGYPAAP